MKLSLAMIKPSKCWLCVSLMSTSHPNGKLLWNNRSIFHFLFFLHQTTILKQISNNSVTILKSTPIPFILYKTNMTMCKTQITTIVTCLSSFNLVHFKLDFFRGRRNRQSFISISGPLLHLLENLHEHGLHITSTHTLRLPWLLPSNTLSSCFHYKSVFQGDRKFASKASSPFPARRSLRKYPY